MLTKTKSPPLLEIGRKRSLKRRLKRIALIVFFFLFLIGAIYAVFFSELFKIKAIEIKGNESVDSQKIMDMAGESFVAKSKFLADNILFYRDKELTELPQDLSEVSSIKISRDFWGRKIVIEVKERNKFAIWCEGSCFWIDEEGVIFAVAPETQGALIKMVKVSSERKLDLGSRPLPEEEIQIFVKIVEFLDSLGLAAKNMYIEDFRFKELKADILNGPTIYFSLIADPTFGRPVVESLRKSGTWGQVDYLDLRVEGRAYYKLK